MDDHEKSAEDPEAHGLARQDVADSGEITRHIPQALALAERYMISVEKRDTKDEKDMVLSYQDAKDERQHESARVRDGMKLSAFSLALVVALVIVCILTNKDSLAGDIIKIGLGAALGGAAGFYYGKSKARDAPVGHGE